MLEAEQKSVGKVAIRFLSGPLAEKVIYIQKPVTVIGRDGSSDIVILDQRISRRHACIRRLNGSWTIENLSQNSHVAINQQRIQQGVLQHNSIVSLGEHSSFVFLVQQPPAQPLPPPSPSATQLALPSPAFPQLPAVLTFVVELGEPLHQGIFLPPVLETYITLALTSLAGLMVGLAISAIAPNNDRAISFVPIILIPQVIFSGAIIPLKDWFTQILSVVFPTRWAMAGLGSSIGLHADKIGGDRLFGDDSTYHSTLYSIYSQADAMHRLLLSWAALGAITITLMILIGLFLKRKDARV